MSDKHYNIGYLEDTAKILKNLKEHSYKPFTTISNGNILDIGCGTGADAIQLAKLLGNKIKVTGIDHDPVMLNSANQSKKGISNINFLQSEVYELAFQNQTIAGIRAERLIQHLTQPDKAIREMYRVLKDNHPIVIVETDWKSLTFYNENIRIEQKINKYLTEQKINNGFAARKLINYLETAGFKDINFDVFPFVVKTLKEAKEYLWVEHILDEMNKKNIISTKEFDLFTQSLNDSDNKRYFNCTINLVIATAVK